MGMPAAELEERMPAYEVVEHLADMRLEQEDIDRMRKEAEQKAIAQRKAKRGH